MHAHNSSVLAGPISAQRTWWHQQSKEPLFRAPLVERIRAEIAAGTYDTPDKWEAALDRLSQRLDAEEA